MQLIYPTYKTIESTNESENKIEKNSQDAWNRRSAQFSKYSPSFVFYSRASGGRKKMSQKTNNYSRRLQRQKRIRKTNGV